jgi:hypothetical protein
MNAVEFLKNATQAEGSQISPQATAPSLRFKDYVLPRH